MTNIPVYEHYMQTNRRLIVSVLAEGTDNSLMCFSVAGVGSLCQTSEGKSLPPRERWELFAVIADCRQFRAE